MPRNTAPSKMNSERLNIPIPCKLKAEVHALAEAAGLSDATYVRVVLLRHVEEKKNGNGVGA